MANISNEAPVIKSEKESHSRISKHGIVALILSILGVTIFFGATVAVIDLFESDDNKKICSTIALCICGIWLFVFIAGGMYSTKYNDETVAISQFESGQEIDDNNSEDSSNNAAKDVSVPKEYQSVMESAIYYYDAMHMSKVGIYEQLTGTHDRFTEEEAQYAMEHLEADWNANALAQAQDYCDMVHMSEVGIYAQLTGEYPYGDQFTEEEAQYAMSHLEADWNVVALASAQFYSDVAHESKAWISNWLVSDYPNGAQFTEEQAQYAMEHVEADWKENALVKAHEYQEIWNMSLDEIHEKLTMEVWEYGGDGFTEEEADYAISNLK